jgi:hypothetical protein
MNLAVEQARSLPGVTQEWSVEDDLCDCTYQRIGYWFNPYIGVTEEVRLCCVWAKFREQWPEFFRTTRDEPRNWNGEAPMPPAIWHRHLASKYGISLSEARSQGTAPPSGTKARPVILLQWSGEWIEVRLGS